MKVNPSLPTQKQYKQFCVKLKFGQLISTDNVSLYFNSMADRFSYWLN